MRTRIATATAIVAIATALGARPASAQPATPGVLVEGGGGYAGFVDDATIDHAMVSGGVRWFVTPRLAIGPEITFMKGPGEDRDLFVTGNATFDLRPRGSAPRAVTPYAIVGAGWMRSRSSVGTGIYYYNEGALTGGAGVRFSPHDRWFVAPEFRLGWELHWRIGAQVGVSLK